MIGVLAIDFGGPLHDADLEPFLGRLLTDVLPGPLAVRSWLGPWLARRRVPEVGPAYKAIGGSPLIAIHRAQVDALRAELGSAAPPIASAMMYTPPEIDDALDDLASQGVDEIVVLPFFPHHSFATSGSASEMVHAAMARRRQPWPLHFATAFPDHPGWITALVDAIEAAASQLGGEGPIHLLFSPHGLPTSFVRRHDPYPDQVRLTCRKVIEASRWSSPWHVGWQSRVGPAAWLTPSTLAQVDAIAAVGASRLLVVPVSFLAENFETLHELDVEVTDHARAQGIAHVGRSAVPGLHPGVIRALADRVRAAIAAKGPTCVRCLLPDPPALRKAVACPNCGWRNAPWTRRP